MGILSKKKHTNPIVGIKKPTQSQHDCVIMGDFNHGQIDWKSLTSANDEDRQFLSLVQDCGLKQCVKEPTRGENILDIVLSSHNVLVDKVNVILK